MKIAIFAPLTLLLMPSLPASAQAAQSQTSEPTVTITRTDGTEWQAQVLSLEGDVVRLRVLVLDGSMEVKRKLAEFKPETAFQIELLATKPSTFDAHFAMAKKAATLRLVEAAGSEARKAVESVAGTPAAEAKTAEVRKWAADALEQGLREAVAAQDPGNARYFLKLLSTRLADQRTEDQLAALQSLVENMAQAVEKKMQGDRQAKLDERTRQDIDRRLGPINARVAAADKLRDEAVAKSGSSAQAAKLDERAVETYKAAAADLRNLAAQYPDDAHLASEVDRLSQHMKENALGAALHAANMLCMQSDYRGATSWVERILAFDPTNAEAKEMRRTIQESAAAASSNWGWGWRRRY